MHNLPSRTLLSSSILLILSSTHVVASEKEDVSKLETITVYGQKIERTTQETKESVAVLDADIMDEVGIKDLNDVYNYTANVYSVDNGEQFGIRGVTQNSKSTGGGTSDIATLFVDDVAYSGFASKFGPKNLWDVEQVEVFRGPQSTNFGRNSLLGAVSVQTKRPDTAGFESAVQADLGNDGRQTYNGMLNIPLSETVAVRLTGTYTEADGYVKNNVLNDDRYDSSRDHNIRGQILFTPNEQLAVNLMLQDGKLNEGRDYYELTPGKNAKDRVSNSKLKEFTQYEMTSSALTIDYQFNSAWSLKSTTSYMEGKRKSLTYDSSIVDAGSINPMLTGLAIPVDIRGDYDSKDKNLSQELRFNYSDEKLSTSFGGYYNKVDLVNDTQFTYNGEIPAMPPVIPQPMPIEIPFNSRFQGKTDGYALFVQADYLVTQTWQLSAGLRYDNEKQDNVAGGNSYDADYDAFLPSLGVTNFVTDNVNVSAFYSRGYRVGGSELLSTGVNQFDPEYLDMYELAFRSEWLDNSLIVNANVYYGDWTDQQLRSDQALPTGDIPTTNAGSSKLYGAEFEVQYYPTADLSLYYNLGLSKAEFDDYKATDNTGNAQDYSSNELAFSPSFTTSLGGRYYVMDNLYLGGNVNYQGEQYANQANTEKLDSRTLVNLNAGYEVSDFLLEAYVDNLTDEFYVTSQFMNAAGNPMVQAGNPREFGIRGTYRY
ncbi:TonB-dependent receptor [Vibrio alginolyticus]|uniref:TonB-dependent receptor n=1 Tax=Vibrio alginolyticus TaxID=663 RepID=UPI000722B79A|nr:TonB-dependent receptor [Vibrio alginolyticus]ALR95490.1 hypothetical protein AT730_24385 [Vibrio alginolyticus]MBY7710014.1 TonB-dependent receptor [Vibrio alginolyticus]